MLYIILVCQLYRVVYYCCSIYFVAGRFSVKFYSSFVRLLFSFDSFAFHCSLFKEKDSILILDCIPGISTCCTIVQEVPSSSMQVNKHIHQISPSLSKYRSEWPITVIDIVGYTRPIFFQVVKQAEGETSINKKIFALYVIYYCFLQGWQGSTVRSNQWESRLVHCEYLI
jgi:hypothetical protein